MGRDQLPCLEPSKFLRQLFRRRISIVRIPGHRLIRDGYQIGGMYRLEGETLELRGRLSRGERSVAELKLTGPAGDAAGLARKLVERALEALVASP